ncbi:MAG: hypothetical protein PHY93_01725 [Bacteriovorax sp.]|nr:hypothetical protein [Bacteriovorax sp.]
MRNFLFGLVLIFALSLQNVSAVETCSRIAIINYQEILVDSNASEKGEGLRYHLEKDPKALQYLNNYQENSAIRWPNALLGTAGTGLLLFGFFTSDSQDRQLYLISGAATILVNFLVARTLEVTNEANLNKAVEEYNKRNLPKIYFNPENNPQGPQGNMSFPGFKIGLAKNWSF